MAYVHQSIKHLREAVQELSAQRLVPYRDAYAVNRAIDVIELLVYGKAEPTEIENAVESLQRALDLVLKDRGT